MTTCSVCCVSTSVTLCLQCRTHTGSPWLWSQVKNKERGRTSTVWATDRLNERSTEESWETWKLQVHFYPGRIMKPLTWTVSVQNYRNRPVIFRSLNCSINLFFLFSACAVTLRSRGLYGVKQRYPSETIHPPALLFLVTGAFGRTLIASRWDMWEDWERERQGRVTEKKRET